MGKKVDKALKTAIETLQDEICECGHYDSEHFLHMPGCGIARCKCKEMQPVKFKVERDNGTGKV